jgi:hypothetical protein
MSLKRDIGSRAADQSLLQLRKAGQARPRRRRSQTLPTFPKHARLAIGPEVRLAIAPGRAALAGRAVIIFQVEQRELPGLLGAPRVELLPAQLDEALPAEGVPVDNKGVGLYHGGHRQAASEWALSCKSCRNSAARCACEAAVKIARLSFFSTLIHDAI